MKFPTIVLSIALGILLFPGFLFAHEEKRYVISMTVDGFDPNALDILEGDTVVFKNNDTRERWPASNIHPTHSAYPGSSIEKCFTYEEEGIFDACKGLLPGEEYAFRFTQAGSWRYHDHLFPDEVGRIEVLSDGTQKEVEISKRSLHDRVAAFVGGIQKSLQRLYYRIFPNKLEEQFSGVSMFDVAQDDVALKKFLVIAGPARVMQELLEESGGATTVRDCHPEAHRMGRISYELYGAGAFEEGGASCHSGYYHGAMEAFLAENGTSSLEEDITALCDIFKSNFGRFECLHGVGHGVMVYENYDLISALDTCDKLGDLFAIESCYGGVFMENVVSAQGRGAVPGHTTTWVSFTDPQFPCNALTGEARLRQCYLMQTSWMMTLTGYDYSKVASYCLEADFSVRSTCFQSLGRDIAGNTLRDPVQINALCSAVPKEEGYYDYCILGAVNVIADFWGPDLKHQAQEFCATVEVSARTSCDAVWQSRLTDFSRGL